MTLGCGWGRGKERGDAARLCPHSLVHIFATTYSGEETKPLLFHRHFLFVKSALKGLNARGLADSWCQFFFLSCFV